MEKNRDGMHPILLHWLEIMKRDANPEAYEAEQRAKDKLKPTKTIWVMRNGQRIKVKDMDDRHLVNTIRLIERHAIAMLERRKAEYLDMPLPNGDGACMAFEQEFDQIMDLEWRDILPPIYHTMQKERERRGLPDPGYTQEEVNKNLLHITALVMMRRKK